jgi:ubiquinone biosynthesis protein
LDCPEETPSLPKVKGLVDPLALPCGTTFGRVALDDYRVVPAKDRPVQSTFAILIRLLGSAIEIFFLRLFRRRNLARAGRKLAARLAEWEGYWPEIGRFLTLRTDIFSEEIREGAASFRGPSTILPFAEVKEIVEEDLGSPLKMLFAEFAEVPMRVDFYADSYRARLRRGDVEVVVKVQRPGLDRRLARDLRVFRFVGLALRRMAAYRNIPWDDVTAIFEERKPSLLDLRYEASSLRRMRKSLRSHKVHVPKLFRDYARKRVMVYEHVDAPTLQEFADYREADPLGAEGWLVANDIDLPAVARRLHGSMLRQICEDNLFLEDLFPSNVVLLRESGIALASCERVSTVDNRFLAVFNMALAAMTRKDYEKFADLVFLLCQSLPVRDLIAVRREIIRAVRRYTAQAELQGATHEEKSMFVLTADLARLLSQNDIVLDWQVLKVMSAMGSTDRSISALDEGMNYHRQLRRYGRKAVKRRLRAVVGRGLLRSAVDVVAPLTEMVRFETASMRKSARRYRSATGKVAAIFATIFRWIGRAVVLGAIVAVWIFLNQYYFAAVRGLAGTEAAKLARHVHRIDYAWWIAIFIGAVILYRIIRDIARYLEANDVTVPQS